MQNEAECHSATVRYYRTFQDDFVQTADQAYALPKDYEWVRRELPFRACSALLYGIGLVCAEAYVRLGLRGSYRNRKALHRQSGGFVLYCNHTHPTGDPFAPALATLPRRTYVIVSPSNLGIPVVGKLLPALGALPVPDDLPGMRKLMKAVSVRLGQGECVVVFPEGHVWPYCTQIRPFPDSAFAFAVDNDVPAFCMTATYQRRRHGAKPRITYYLDGPFTADATLPHRQRLADLNRQVHARMCERSRASTYEYVSYRAIESEAS
jgi:1-acyl-sn-glycerol-3-phosphate acyltransferase